MSPVEIWRPVLGWEGLYEASSLGRIRSIERWTRGRHRGIGPHRVRRRSKVLRLVLNQHGYLAGNFSRRGGRVNFELHRAICEAFHGPAPEGFVAAHWDGVRTNCAASNLRWATIAENQNDMVRHGTLLRGEQKPCARLTEDDVRAIRGSQASTSKLARQYGVHWKTLSAARSGQTWKHVEGAR